MSGGAVGDEPPAQRGAAAERPAAPGGAFRGKGGLGRGLGALIPPALPEAEQAATADAPATPSRPSERTGGAGADGPVAVDIDLIAPNPRQPRSAFDAEQLAALAESIRQHGLLQPLVVSRKQSAVGGVSYQLIAGERRLHAARAAGLRRVPVVVREASPQQQLELALVENIQRADLNPLEEALAFQRLATDFGLTQEALAHRVGRGRVAVANTLRLLGLPDEIKASLAGGEITEGHARALLGLATNAERRRVWQRAVERGLSVRDTEALVRALRDAAGPAEKPDRKRAARRSADPDLARVADRLQAALGTAVQITRGRRGGRVVIQFYSDEELDGLLQALLGDRADDE